MRRSRQRCGICNQDVVPCKAEKHARTHRVCLLCGPWQSTPQHNTECPTCGLDEGEVRAREQVMRLGGAEVYRQECEAERKRRLSA